MRCYYYAYPGSTEEEISEFLRALFSLFPAHIPYAVVPRPWCYRKKWPYRETEIAFTLKGITYIAFHIPCFWESIDFMPMREDQIDSIARDINNEEILIGILLAPKERNARADLKYHNVVFPDHDGWIENMDHLVDHEGYLFLGNGDTMYGYAVFLCANDQHQPVLESPLIKKYWEEQCDLREIPPSGSL
jgi:hypothetical protein